MQPLGISVAQLRKALPSWPQNLRDWDDDLNWLLEKGSRRDEILIVDLALALDHVFGCAEGYFLRLWAACAARSRSQTMQRWLAKVKRISNTERFAAFPDFLSKSEELCPPKTAVEILASAERQLKRSKPKLRRAPKTDPVVTVTCHRKRKRILLPEFRKLMAQPPGDEIQSALDETRGARSKIEQTVNRQRPERRGLRS